MSPLSIRYSALDILYGAWGAFQLAAHLSLFNTGCGILLLMCAFIPRGKA